MSRTLAISALLALAGCVHAPPRNHPEPPRAEKVVAAEFELTRDDGSRVTWVSSNHEKEPFVDSVTPIEYTVGTYPGKGKDYIAVSLRRFSGRPHSLVEPFDTRNLPRQAYLQKKCNLLSGSPCEVRERGKSVASVRRIK